MNIPIKNLSKEMRAIVRDYSGLHLIEEKFIELIEDEIEYCTKFTDDKKAMKYLINNDVDLSKSLQLAISLGYDCNNISPSLLATLLLQSKLRDDLATLKKNVNLEL